MTLFFSLLPLYLFGNLHCFGMCGPLVMLIGQHRYRYFYFFGRILSFSLAGFIAGGMGAVLHLFLKQYYLAEGITLLGGILILLWGVYKVMGWHVLEIPIQNITPLNHFHHWVSTLLLKDNRWPTFLFGFFTVALPCGQTLIVFSACALTGDAVVGFWNGFAFALLTTPSLVVAMHTLKLFKNLKQYDQTIMGTCAIFVGVLACCRGFAEAGWMEHFVLNPDAPAHYHLILF